MIEFHGPNAGALRKAAQGFEALGLKVEAIPPTSFAGEGFRCKAGDEYAVHVEIEKVHDGTFVSRLTTWTHLKTGDPLAIELSSMMENRWC